MINKVIYWTFSIIRPLLGPAACRYSISCMEYARVMLEDNGALAALWLITKRVWSCNGLWSSAKKDT